MASRAARTGATGAAPADTTPTLLYLAGRLDRVVRRAIQDAVRPYGLSVNEFTTLSVLARRHGLSNAQLARRSLVSPQSANEVLLALERQGLVRRQAHPAHGRILQTRLTAKGRRVLAACDARVATVEARMVANLSPAQQTALRRAILQCVQALSAESSSPGSAALRQPPTR
ncbi:MAG TPA: MarR family transcriptional regulator [Acidimicrobiales bacterium]|nr:MarR family transcriptional regulator [Acidimicrobiales bacterium]